MSSSPQYSKELVADPHDVDRDERITYLRRAVLEALGAVRRDLEGLESEMESAGTPWTPGRLPEGSPE